MAKKSSITIGIILILLGIIGFLGGWGIVGSTGVFLTNTWHDVVNLVLGIVLVVAGYASVKSASLWLKVVAVVLLVLALLGFIWGSPLLGFAAVNGADNWLHLVLAIVIFLFGWYGSKDASVAAPAAPAQQ